MKTIILAFFAFVLIGCASTVAVESGHGSPTSPLRNRPVQIENVVAKPDFSAPTATDQRLARAHQLLAIVAAISTRVRIPEVTDAADKLLFGAITCAPTANIDGSICAEQMLETTNNQPWVRVLPLVKEDGKISTIWKKEASTKNTIARYNHETNSIVLPPQDVSAVWQAYVFIHEACHWLGHTSGQVPAPTNNQEYVIEECRVFSIEFEMITADGGEAYQSALNDEIKRQESRVKFGVVGQDGVKRTSFIMPGAYDKRLEKVGAKSVSEYEKRIRSNILWMNGFFALADRSLAPSDAFNRKCDFLMWAYRNNHSLPVP